MIFNGTRVSSAPCFRRALAVVALAMAPACGLFVGIKDLEVEPVVDGGGTDPRPDADAGPPVFEASVPETYVPPPIDAGCKLLSKGPLEPKNVEQTGPGVAWDRLNDGKTSNDVSTVVSALGGDDSKTITFSGYDVAVPPTARVFGVKAELRARATAQNFFADKSIKLTLGGATVGADLARPDNYTTTFESRVYGGDTNPWGIGLTPEIVNALGFGIAFRSQRPANVFIGIPAFSFAIDVVRITVFYCE